MKAYARAFALAFVLVSPLPLIARSPFVRGDANADGRLDVSDAVTVLLGLFVSAAVPECEDAHDANDDGALDVSDAVRLLGHLFQALDPLPDPYSSCGEDPTDDGLGCASHGACFVSLDGDPTITEWTVPWSNTRPRDPYVDAAGLVWFVGQLDDYVGRLDPESGEFERFDLPDGAGPHNLIVGDRVWYAGNGDAHIGHFALDGGPITRIDMPDSSLRDPHTLVFDSSGDIWFTAQNSNFVGALDTSTGDVRVKRVPTTNARPYGIVVDRADRVWFVEFGRNKLAELDRETLDITEHLLPRSGARPRRVGVTSDGLIWYVDYQGGYLGRFDPELESFAEWQLPGGSGARPYGMAVDDRDRIWLVETGPIPNRFVGFNPATEEFFSRTAIPSRGGAVRHMHFHASERAIWFGTDAGTIGRAVVP